MSETEYTIWRVIVGVVLWLLTGALGARLGDAVAAELSPILLVLFAVFATWATRRRQIWRIAYVSRLPMLGVGLLVNRRWRQTFAIAREPVLVGAQLIWVDRTMSEQERALIPRLGAALDVIAELSPGRHARLMRIAPTLVVARMCMAACYMPGVNVIAIDCEWLRASPEVVASILIHELCHARLYDRGMLHQFYRAWHEHLARRDQGVFAHRLHHAGRDVDAVAVLKLVRDSRNADDGLRARMKRMRERYARVDSVDATAAGA